MTDYEARLRKRLDDYLETVEPLESAGVGLLLTGSLAAGYAGEHSDVDLTLVVADDQPPSLEKRLVPPEATVQQSGPEQYSFDWHDGHFDVFVTPLTDIADLDLPTRWEYDNAEVLIDPDGRVLERLEQVCRLGDDERASLVEEHADRFCWAGQWDVHKACLRDDPEAAHHIAGTVLDDLLVCVFLRDGALVPRAKWLRTELRALPTTDATTAEYVRNATLATEMTTEDIHRRMAAMKAVWDDVAADFRTEGVYDPMEWENDVVVDAGGATN